MAAVYLGTSALVKRYVAEVGTRWVITLVGATNTTVVFTARFTGPEMISALERKVRTGESARPQIERATTRFAADWQWRYEIIEVTTALADHAMRLARRYPLRAFDAVHITAALTADEIYRRRAGTRVTFISADRNQLQAAQSEGMLTDDPNNHP